MSELTPDQSRRLRQALLEAYPGLGQLRIFVSDRFGRNLQAITSTETLEVAVHDLIVWAESVTCARELVGKALSERPANPALQALADELAVDTPGDDRTRRPREVHPGAFQGQPPSASATAGPPPQTGDTADRRMSERAVILFLAANPSGTSVLALDEEIRDIGVRIRAAAYRDVLTLKPRLAVRADDLIQALNEDGPRVVHFSGHGSSEGILLVGWDKKPHVVSPDALVFTFRTIKKNVRLVVLNACFTQPLAEALVGVIDCAVGIDGAIGDEAARVFAASFYRALGFGESVRNAFDQGLAALMLQGIKEEDKLTLLSRTGVDPSRVFVLEDPRRDENPPTVLLLHADPDRDWMERLRLQLRVFEVEGLLSVWARDAIEPGSNVQQTLEAAIAGCHAAVLLVSASLLTSDLFRGAVWPRLQQRRNNGEVRLLVLMVSPTNLRAGVLAWPPQRPAGKRTLSELGRAKAERALADLAVEVFAMLGGGGARSLRQVREQVLNDHAASGSPHPIERRQVIDAIDRRLDHGGRTKWWAAVVALFVAGVLLAYAGARRSQGRGLVALRIEHATDDRGGVTSLGTSGTVDVPPAVRLDGTLPGPTESTAVGVYVRLRPTDVWEKNAAAVDPAGVWTSSRIAIRLPGATGSPEAEVRAVAVTGRGLPDRLSEIEWPKQLGASPPSLRLRALPPRLTLTQACGATVAGGKGECREREPLTLEGAAVHVLEGEEAVCVCVARQGPSGLGQGCGRTLKSDVRNGRWVARGAALDGGRYGLELTVVKTAVDCADTRSAADASSATVLSVRRCVLPPEFAEALKQAETLDRLGTPRAFESYGKAYELLPLSLRTGEREHKAQDARRRWERSEWDGAVRVMAELVRETRDECDER